MAKGVKSTNVLNNFNLSNILAGRALFRYSRAEETEDTASMTGLLKQEIVQRQIQTLNITQEMRLRIELLQKNMLDLREMLIRESEENPFLEIVEWGDESPDGTPVENTRGDTDANDDEIPAAPGSGDRPERLGEESARTMSDILADHDWRNYQEHSGNNFGEARVRRRNDEPDDNPIEETVSEKEPVTRRLDLQIAATEMPDRIKETMIYLVYNLDERGFLRDTDEDIAATLEIPVEEARDARAALRLLDPAGTGSLDLPDYLRFIFSDPEQLAEPDISADLIRKLVDSPVLLDALAKKDFARLCQELDIGKQQLSGLLAVMRKVAPYPFFGHETFTPEQVIPDIRVHLVEGEVVIEIERKFIPSIQLNRELYDQKVKSIRDKQKRSLMRERFRAAEWLVKSLSERNKTLYEVAASLFNFQRAFLENGPDFLRPLTLKDISEDIGRHQSTVSRLTNGKYAVTPFGIFELKSFFVKRINEESLATTNRHLETRLRELIAAEDPASPLSDEDLVRILSHEGVAIARRTIGKYRDKLRIPSARERRRDHEFLSGGD